MVIWEVTPCNVVNRSDVLVPIY